MPYRTKPPLPPIRSLGPCRWECPTCGELLIVLVAEDLPKVVELHAGAHLSLSAHLSCPKTGR